MTRIDVTAEDIAKGEAGSSARCPVALALQRAISKPVAVSKTYVYISGYNLSTVMLPSEASEFIGKFDRNHEPVKPFTFHIEIPLEVLV